MSEPVAALVSTPWTPGRSLSLAPTFSMKWRSRSGRWMRTRMRPGVELVTRPWSSIAATVGSPIQGRLRYRRMGARVWLGGGRGVGEGLRPRLVIEVLEGLTRLGERHLDALRGRDVGAYETLGDRAGAGAATAEQQ